MYVRYQMTAIAQAIPQLELTYFNGRGLAETSRILLALADQPYTDTRFPLKVIDWSTYSFERNEFDKAKAEGKLIKSVGKVPFLTANGSTICQSKAIERYLARRFGFLGSSEEEAAQIDAFCEHIRDIKTSYQSPRKIKDKTEKEQALQKFFSQELPKKLLDIELSIEDSKYVIGDKVSLADVTLFGLVEFFDNKEGILNALPENLLAKYNQVASLPRVASWIKSRPETPF